MQSLVRRIAMVQTPIYLDNHATTQVDSRVVDVVVEAMTTTYGNAGSIGHAFGEHARNAVEAARQRIAAAIGANPREIVFTSGATESNNLALRGVADRARRRGSHVVSVSTEHKAVLDPLARLARGDFDVTYLAPRQHGHPDAGWLDPQQVADALRDDSLLVSVMLANNEIGVVQPIAEIGAICGRRGVLLHCDATQAVGKIPVDVGRLNVDLMSFSSHKMFGPKGTGALYVRTGPPQVRLMPQIDGGGQEGGRRSGTLNVPGILGFVKALELCVAEQPEEGERLKSLRNRLYNGLTHHIEGIELNGPDLDSGLRLAHNLNVSFEGVDGEALMLGLPELAVSSGSACTSANPEPSHVLRALGRSEDRTRSSLRFGLGRYNTQAEIDIAVERVTEAVARLRQLGSTP